MMEIIFASANRGKIAELKAIFSDTNYKFLFVGQEIEEISVEESGSTFAENAEIKARAFAQKYQLPTLADDSGLEVDSLDGRPGVNSNRWHDGSDHDRNIALLELMQNQSNRAARFITVACLFFPQTENLHFFEGTVSGRISHEITGDQGFGYDPIFVPDGYEQSFASLGLEVKNQLSHRARAFIQVKKFLESQYGQK